MNFLLASVLGAIALTEADAQQADVSPKLVVSITIDQLRYDYMERFSPLFGEKGFKRLMREGKVYRNGYCDFFAPDIASAIASIYTGTSPSDHGIIGKEWFDKKSDKIINCVEDSRYVGNYIRRGYSPERSRMSGLCDELKISTQGKALAFAIAPVAEAAVLAASRNANCALWVNPENGLWCSSTYYRELPSWVSSYNDAASLEQRIDKMVWTPLRDAGEYRFVTSEWQGENFAYDFGKFRSLKYEKLIASGLVNEEVNNLAERCLSESGVGADDIPDLLMLTYYAGNFDHRSDIECALEIQDTYVRLDKELERIIRLAEKQVGANNVMFVVSSTGYVEKETADLGKYNIPSGEFFLNRCAALLNMFLMAQFGDGQYVAGFHDNQIYFNDDLLKEKKLEKSDIAKKSKEFLVTFSGVSKVFTSEEILLGSWSPDMQRVRNKYNRSNSGDIFIELIPGWSSRTENSYEYRVDRANFIASPIIFWGNGVKSALVQTPVSTDVIAPTIAYYLRIRAPNAAKAIPVTDLKN